MHRTVKLAFVATMLWLGGVAFADSKSDAQAKVDAAKTEVCEKGKKFLADQEAKGKCKTESAEAKKITCSAATSKDMNDLLNKCTSGKSADARTDDKAAEPAAAGGTRCRALDPNDEKIVIEEAEDKLSTRCTRLLIEKLQARWCTADNKGKKFDYISSFDHTIGTGKFAKQIKGKKMTHTCHTVAK